MIFGQKLAVFIFFDKEKMVRFLSEFFYPVLWLAAHWVKRFSGASEQIEGVKKIPKIRARGFTMQTHIFALCTGSFTLKKLKKNKWGLAAS